MSDNKGFLTTHVLDTANGVPAEGIDIELYLLTDTGGELKASATTNADGRTGEPLLKPGELELAIYELHFRVGDYFSKQTEPSALPFIDQVPIRFGISDANAHYHVPLLVSPFSYSTYRGS